MGCRQPEKWYLYTCSDSLILPSPKDTMTLMFYILYARLPYITLLNESVESAPEQNILQHEAVAYVWGVTSLTETLGIPTQGELSSIQYISWHIIWHNHLNHFLVTKTVRQWKRDVLRNYAYNSEGSIYSYVYNFPIQPFQYTTLWRARPTPSFDITPLIIPYLLSTFINPYLRHTTNHFW